MEPKDLADRQAEFVQQITRAQRRLYGFIYTLVRRSADAEDVLQETNLVLWNRAETYRPGTDFMTWAFQIAHFQVMAYRKRQARVPEPFDDALITALADAARTAAESTDRRQGALARCLEKLKPEQKQLIVGRYQPGTSVQALAARLGKTAKALSEGLRRIREALMECIERTLAMGEQG